MPNVLNKRTDKPTPGCVYVGRPTKWGNPFSHLPSSAAKWRVASRDEAVDMFEQWLLTQPELLDAVKKELRGRDLMCWCSPQRCHADVLIRIANMEG